MLIDKRGFRIINIQKVIDETPTVRTFLFEDQNSYLAKPGQFLMVWIPRSEELPLSIMIADTKNYAAITIRKQGYGSSALFNMREGDKLGIRGPYGNSFVLKQNYKKIVMIGGGTGLVPLMRFLNTHKGKNVKFTIIIGARTRNELFFEKLIKSKSNSNIDVIIATEDGSKGFKGLATDALEKIIIKQKSKFDAIYTCGPELMMKKVHNISLKYKIPLQASIERYMKCGIGICSSCAVDDKLVCTDGTVFNEKQLDLLTEFGMSFRNKAGILENY